MGNPDRSAVEQQLDRILVSPRFASAARLSAFLRFVVQSELAGNSGSTKEMVIAAEVYGRGPDYDPQVDSTVRAEASRLRQRLAEYYSTAGVSDPVLIEIPKGTYAPSISFRQPASRPEPTPELGPEPSQPPVAPRRRLATRAWAVVAITAGLLVAAMVVAKSWSAAQTQSAAKFEGYARRLMPAPQDHLLRAGHPEPEYSLETALEAAQFFEKAIDREPARAGAWAGLARAYELAGRYDSRYYAKSKDAARRSLDLDPANAEANYEFAYISHFQDWDFAGAQRGFARAIEAQPHWESAYRHFGDAASLVRQFDAADARLQAGLRVFPASSLLRVSQAMLRFHQERFEDMLATARLLPDNLDLAHWVRGLALEQQGDRPQARAELERCLAISPRLIRCAIALIYLDAQTGRAAEAEARAASLADHDGEMIIARIFQYAGARDRAKTLEWIQRGIALHEHSVPWLLIDPRFKHLWPDPEFRHLASRVTQQP